MEFLESFIQFRELFNKSRESFKEIAKRRVEVIEYPL